MPMDDEYTGPTVSLTWDKERSKDNGYDSQYVDVELLRDGGEIVDTRTLVVPGDQCLNSDKMLC